MCFSRQRRAIFLHRNFKKWSETVSFLTFWLGNVLLATAACNFSTSQLQKALRTPQFFLHFDLEMCFSPQRRAIFQHLNFKKCSEPDVFCTFWLQNVLLATAACKFLISPPTTWLRTRRFNEPTFRLTRHTNHWKNTAFRDFSNIWRGWIFFLLTSRYCIFFLRTLLHLSAFHPLFNSPYCRKFTI